MKQGFVYVIAAPSRHCNHPVSSTSTGVGEENSKLNVRDSAANRITALE